MIRFLDRDDTPLIMDKDRLLRMADVRSIGHSVTIDFMFLYGDSPRTNY